MNVIPLSALGLVTVEEAAAQKGCAPSTVRRWARLGLIPVVVVGSGRSAKFLLRTFDLDGFTPGPVGAPAGNQNAVKKKHGPKKPLAAKKSLTAKKVVRKGRA